MNTKLDTNFIDIDDCGIAASMWGVTPPFALVAIGG